MTLLFPHLMIYIGLQQIINTILCIQITTKVTLPNCMRSYRFKISVHLFGIFVIKYKNYNFGKMESCNKILIDN